MFCTGRLLYCHVLLPLRLDAFQSAYRQHIRLYFLSVSAADAGLVQLQTASATDRHDVTMNQSEWRHHCNVSDVRDTSVMN